MKPLHKKDLKEENYDFFHTIIEKEENPFKPNSNATIISQLIIWIAIGVILVLLISKFYYQK